LSSPTFLDAKTRKNAGQAGLGTLLTIMTYIDRLAAAVGVKADRSRSTFGCSTSLAERIAVSSRQAALLNLDHSTPVEVDALSKP